MAVVLADVLDERTASRSSCRRQTCEEALREIVATMACEGSWTSRRSCSAKCCAREEAHTTFMGNGVAFPHARTDLVNEIVLGIGRSRGRRSVRPRGRARAPHLRDRRAATDGDGLSRLRRRAGAFDPKDDEDTRGADDVRQTRGWSSSRCCAPGFALQLGVSAWLASHVRRRNTSGAASRARRRVCRAG